MGWFNDDSQEADQYDQFNNAPHKAKLSHEVIGGAAAFEAMKAYEAHKRANGEPDNHAKAKEVCAGIAGAVVDRLVETKGEDAWANHEQKQKIKQDTYNRLCNASAPSFGVDDYNHDPNNYSNDCNNYANNYSNDSNDY